MPGNSHLQCDKFIIYQKYKWLQSPKFMETLKQTTCSKHWNFHFFDQKIQHYKSIISNDVFIFTFKFSSKAAEFHEFEFDSIGQDRYHSDIHRT